MQTKPRCRWALLDDVVMLAKGHLVYEGRCSHVLPWFSDTLGYRCNGVDRHPGEYALALGAAPVRIPSTPSMLASCGWILSPALTHGL
jgi:hypothetical protein